MRIRLALVAITAVAVSVVSCTPERQSTIYPNCGEGVTVTCLEVKEVDHGDGWGYLVSPDGSIEPVNFWADGEVERF